jgi:hypothetical protein
MRSASRNDNSLGWREVQLTGAMNGTGQIRAKAAGGRGARHDRSRKTFCQ